MKFKELKETIQNVIDLEVELYSSFDNYDTALIALPDGGKVNVGLRPKKRNLPFLHFDVRYSKIRLSCSSSSYSGKYNYFGENQKEILMALLEELKTLI